MKYGQIPFLSFSNIYASQGHSVAETFFVRRVVFETSLNNVYIVVKLYCEWKISSEQLKLVKFVNKKYAIFEDI